MASNWAIVIGINQYRFLQPLKYAKRDAEAMHNFLMQEARFDRIFLFTDDSPAIGGKPTEPFRANLLRVLRQIFASPFMKDGDNFWFFFSGHGIPHNGQDYLMPLDGDPEDIENTGISTNTITNYLRSCGGDNAVMILDACRSGGKKAGEGIGRQTGAEARQTGVISLFSCSPDQYSYELENLGQGAFTYALLEGLGIRGRCATVEQLNQYLEHRVPELVNQNLGSVRQIPYTIAEPLNRAHLILMPQHANLADIATLKNDAYRAERQQNLELAQRLWLRVNAAASGKDMEAIEALQNLGIQRHTRTAPPQPEPPQTAESSKASSKATPSLKKDTVQQSPSTTLAHSASTARPSPVPVPQPPSPSRSSPVPVTGSPRLSTAASPSFTRKQVLTPDPPSEVDIKKSTGWIIALSIVLILLGVMAILLPGLGYDFFSLVMGWIALISGVVMIVQSFVSKPVRGFWLNLVVGILYVIAGIYILTHLVAYLLGLTLAFGILFIAEGIYTIIIAFTNRAGHRASWLVVLNGVITLILGIMVLNQFPFSAFWWIGLYVGISLLMSGVSLLAAALAVRKAVATNP